LIDQRIDRVEVHTLEEPGSGQNPLHTSPVKAVFGNAELQPADEASQYPRPAVANPNRAGWQNSGSVSLPRLPPGDLLVAQDIDDIYAQLATPPITAVDLHPSDQMAQAVAMIIDPASAATQP
jgi:hypothetical protein